MPCWLSVVGSTVVCMEGNHDADDLGTSLPSPLDLPARRRALEAARTALTGVGEVLHQAGGDDLGPLLAELDRLVVAGEAGRVAVVGEAMARGEVSSGRAQTVVQWLTSWAPSLRAGGAGEVVALATAFGKRVNAPVQQAVDAGSLPVRSAATVVAEFDRLRPILGEHAQAPVMRTLIETAAEAGPGGCRKVRPWLLARFGLEGRLQEEQDAAKRFVALSRPHDDGTGIFEYRLRLDLEGKSVLEAAVGPLSAPRPADGERDLRPSDQRRGDALVELVQRAVQAGESVPTTAKAQLFVTVDYSTLADSVRANADAGAGASARTDCGTGAGARTDCGAGVGGATLIRAGATVGGADSGTLLAPETVRRLACDASIIPVVLGTRGEVLDFGHEKRLFTPAQTKRLWLRDGGCTFPGCSAPAHWCQAHHLVHWADFGPTDLENAALVCRHHHTTVHKRHLAGVLVHDEEGEHVEWDLTRGSYDLLLAQRQARRRA